MVLDDNCARRRPAHVDAPLSLLQAKNLKTPGSLSGWPRNATKFILNLVENAEANAVGKSLDVDNLVISHSQVNMAPKGRRRTYRAHGRIGPYLRVPSHIEIILTSKNKEVPKAAAPAAPRLHKRVLAKRIPASRFISVGGGDYDMPALE